MTAQIEAPVRPDASTSTSTADAARDSQLLPRSDGPFGGGRQVAGIRSCDRLRARPLKVGELV
eukprot:COSAG06_NODE_3543_length_5206_cov_3.184257_1_plen_63_part_00